MKALCLFALFGLLIVVGCEDGTDGENETLTVVNQLNQDIVIDFERSDSSFDIEPKSKRIPADDRLKIKSFSSVVQKTTTMTAMTMVSLIPTI